MRAVIRAAARAVALGLFDRGDGIPEERLTWLLDDTEAFLSHAGRRPAWLFALVLIVLEWLPAWFFKRWTRLSRLSSSDRERFLEELDESRFAILLALPKAVLGLVYYEHPDALGETGYDFGCLLGDLPAGVSLVRLPPRVPSRPPAGEEARV